MSSETDLEHIEMLRKSADQVGFLSKVLVEKGPGTILSGKHRKESRPDWPTEEVEVQDELHRELIVIHANIQRRVPDEVTATRIKRIAEILEKRGVPKPDICAKIGELVPFSPRWIRELLPDEYKHQEKRNVSSPREDAEVVPHASMPEGKEFDEHPVMAPKKLEKSAAELTTQQKMLLQPFGASASPQVVEYPFPDCRCKDCPRRAGCPSFHSA